MAIYTAALLLVGVSKGYEDYLKTMPNQNITDAWANHALGHLDLHEYLCEEEEKGEGRRLCEREMRKDTTRRHT